LELVVRNNVPGGEEVSAFPPPGVARAGGARDDGLIECLRTKIKALEQVPVSLAFPPAPGSGPSHLACSLFSLPAFRQHNSPRLFDNEGQWAQASFRGHDKVARLEPPPKEELPPLNRLEAAGLHEIKPQAYADEPAALAFVFAFLGDRLAGRKKIPLLWCLTERMAREWGAPYGPGLLAFNLDPEELLIVQTRTAVEAAWALEEGLKARAFVTAMGQFEIKAPLAARRLGLAAQASRTPCLLLSGHRGSGLPGTLTRWRISAARSTPTPFDASAPGAPAWQLTLERCRGIAPSRSWVVEFRNDAYGVRLDAALSDREVEAGERRRMASG
jgi:protein ImuA